MYSMKKIFSILSAGLVALAAVSCVQEKMTVFDPAKATAPVLASYEVTDAGITADFAPGSFGQSFNTQMPVNHSLVIVSVNGANANKMVSATIKDNIATASASNISKALMALGCEVDSYASFDMVIRASMQEVSKDNGRNGHVDSEGKISVTDFHVVEQKGSPYQDYTELSSWTVIGSLAAYEMSWDKDLVMWTDGEGNHVAAHVTLTADDEFKFRQDQDWAVNMGGEFGGLDSDFSVTQDGANIKVGADGVYDLFFSESGMARIAPAYDPYPDYTEASNWSVIGALSNYGISWDGDIAMITDGTSHVALGVNIAADDEFKFRQDKDWAVNMGGEFAGVDTEFAVTQDGPNVKVGADGVFDLFVNPDAGTALVAKASGAKVSYILGSDEPEPEPITGWNIIGLNGDWDNDIIATQNGNVWSAFITAKDETTFKWRKDGGWDENYGGTLVSLGEPFEAVAGGGDIKVSAGFYKVELDTENLTITVSNGEIYSLIGQINGDSWSKDVEMTFKDGVWTSPVVTIDGGFKIRHNFSWADEDCYGLASGEIAEVGKEITLEQPGADISLAAGDYKVQFNPESKKMLISTVAYPEQLYMIGDEFGGWDWGSDGVVEMTPVIHKPDWGAEAEAQFWTIRYFTADKGFKFNSKKAWGGDFWGLTENDGFVEKEGNCTVAEDGFYLVHIDLKNEKVHVEPARVYGIGDCFGGWDAKMEGALFQADGKTLKATAQADGELRMYAESAISTSDWWTREFIILDGVIDYRGDDEGQGDQERVKIQKGQVVSLNFNAGTGSVDGEGEDTPLPETMYIIGDGVGGWDWATNAVDMIPVNGKAGQFWAIRYIENGKGFKFCAQKAWSGDFYSLGEEDSGFTVSDNNCFVAEKGVYMIDMDTENKKICVEPAKVYGIGDCFGGWDAKMEGALFTATEDGKLVGTTKAAGQIRLYAESTAATSDWWTREFVFFEGKIAYRGNGGDQERVTVDAGKKVTLDFNAGTAVVE